MSVNLDNMLLTACKNGQKGIVQAFLKKGGIQLDKRDVQGATPLHYASAKGSRDIVKLLLDAGADPSIPDNQSRTALHLACQIGNKDIIRLLWEKGAELNGTDKEGSTPLIYAAKYGRSEVCRFLLELGADKTLTDEDGHNAFDYAASNGMRDVIALLEDEQRQTDHEGNTTLHHACYQNQSEVVEALISTGRVDVNALNDTGDTPLSMACENQNVYLVEILLKAGADPNRKLLDGFSPLHYAA